jgi:two-component system LytT family response regulator
VRNGERIRVITTEQIEWVRADGNYVLIKSGGVTYLHRESLRNLIAALDPARFLRIHRAILVNIERIREVHSPLQGSAEVVLHDGTRLRLSRRFRPQARRALGLP